MPETIQSFLDKVKDAAAVLGESDTIDLITAVKNQTSNSKLRLLVVGSAGSGRFSVANFLLVQPELLPTSPIPKAAISLVISHGEKDNAEVCTKNGTRMVIPVEKLRSFLTSPDTQASNYLNIELKTNCDLLKTCELRIENINGNKNIAEWKELLAGTDYAILVLNATALLSEKERHFVRDILKPNLGLERVAIVINQMDLVPEDERLSISEMVRTFLGSFESQSVLMEFSAAKANKALKSGDVTTNGYKVLSNFVKVDLVEKHSFLKSAAMHQAAEICLTEVTESAVRQNSLISTNETELQELLDKIDSQSQGVESHIQRAQQKIEIFVNTFLKEEFFREIEGFGFALRQQLSEEIMLIEDVTTIRRHLPGYIEAVWAEFFDSQLASIRNKLINEMKGVDKNIQGDLRELLGDKASNLQSFLSIFDQTPANLRNLLMPRRSKNKVGFVATGLQLGGFLVLVANLPLGLAAIGSGQIVRMLGKKTMETDDKKAILESAIGAIQELEGQIKQQVESQFVELTNKLKTATADLYTEGITKIRSGVKDAIASHQDLLTKKEKIDRLVSVTVPELKQHLEQLVTGGF
ncbi:hypothetical protein [Microcoleus sp.]|uniref:hypothetical protein n=1 Tax=Microcoleus sp. TaxID=44472 RepID=UPI003524254A